MVEYIIAFLKIFGEDFQVKSKKLTTVFIAFAVTASATGCSVK